MTAKCDVYEIQAPITSLSYDEEFGYYVAPEEIEICTNNDFAGRWAADHIAQAYADRYRIVRNLPEREGCDYADLAKQKLEERITRDGVVLSR